MFSSLTYAEYMLTIYRLKERAMEIAETVELFQDYGISTTWRNRSNQARLAQQMRKQGKYS